MIELKSRYRDAWLQEEDFVVNKLWNPDFKLREDAYWGLKQMGKLFCWDAIVTHNPTRLLEAGAGFDVSFDRRMRDDQEFWIADSPGFYPQELLDAANKIRRAKFVPTLMSEFSPELPSDYFDIVFSVSALEHSRLEASSSICKDMFRVMRPGGLSVHSIDTLACHSEHFAHTWYDSFVDAGFEIEGGFGENRWIISPNRGESTLSEPLERVFLNYEGQRDDPWTNPTMPTGPFGTVLVIAKKPA